MTHHRHRHIPNNMSSRLANIGGTLVIIGLPIFLVVGRVRGWF